MRMTTIKAICLELPISKLVCRNMLPPSLIIALHNSKATSDVIHWIRELSSLVGIQRHYRTVVLVVPDWA